MRKSIREFAEIVSSNFPVTEPIYEFGSFQVPGQNAISDLRPLFPNKEYVGCDMREGPGVDKILNLHALDLPSESVGMVICLDTMEHVEYPRKALDEIYRVLKPNGTLIMTSVMNFPIHEYPYDYWRFTPEAFKSLLKPFESSFVGFQGTEIFPHTVVGIGVKGKMPPLTEFTKQYEKWVKSDNKSIIQIGLKLTPPILLPLATWVYRSLAAVAKPSA